MSLSERSRLATVIRKIAKPNLGEIFSLKRSRAISEVATISKLLRSDTDSAEDLEMAIMRNTGARISSTTIPMRYG